ncbi:MAG: carbon storage regulator CsrA [Firmicutes bacterium]|nr:carbon storage regulator CsrA [Bacillota bacterium]
MLVLTRKANQSIIIGEDIVVTVIAVEGDAVKIGIDAPKDVSVFRREVYETLQRTTSDKPDEGEGGDVVQEALRKLDAHAPPSRKMSEQRRRRRQS